MQKSPTKSFSHVFDKDTLNDFFESANVSQLTVETSKPNVYVGIKVNSETSNITIITGVACKGNITIVGIEHVEIESIEDYKELIKTHVEKIREIPCLQDAQIIPVLEKKPGQEFTNLIDFLKNDVNTHPFCQPTQESIIQEKEFPGVKTTSCKRRVYMIGIDKMVNKKKLKFLKDGVCIHPFQSKGEVVFSNFVMELHYFLRIAIWLYNDNTSKIGLLIDDWTTQDDCEDMVFVLGMMTNWANYNERYKYY